MNELTKIIQNVKKILFNLKIVPTEKIFDKDVAGILKLSPNTLALMKKRNSIPYKEIIEFCYRNSIELTTVLYGTVVVDRVEA